MGICIQNMIGYERQKNMCFCSNDFISIYCPREEQDSGKAAD